MTKAVYSDELLTQIANNTWQDGELDLSEQNLNADAAQELATALQSNFHIKTLNLSYNKIGDKGAKAFADNKVLTGLWLIGNDISAEGNEAIEKMLIRNQVQAAKIKEKRSHSVNTATANDKKQDSSVSSSSSISTASSTSLHSDFNASVFSSPTRNQISSSSSSSSSSSTKSSDSKTNETNYQGCRGFCCVM